MALNRTFFRVDVSETERDRNYWAAKTTGNAELVSQIRSADILFVPWENRGKEELTFPTGTAEFFHTVSRRFAPGAVVLASTPEAYVELALHSNETRWPTIIVSTVLLTALGNILSDEIEKALSGPTPPATIEMQVIVENERGKCISVQYKGPPDRMVNTLIAEAERCLPAKPEKAP